MLKALLVDDEKYIRDELKYFLDRIEEVEVVAETGDGDEVLDLVREHRPDILFLDIELRHTNGLTLARRLMEMEDPPQIILSTAYDKYAVMGFELSVSDYILKPFSLERLRSAVKKAAADRGLKRLSGNGKGEKRSKIAVSKADRLFLIDVGDIRYFQADGNTAVLDTTEGVFTLSVSLKDLEEALPGDRFLRIHKSNIVNVDYIEEIVPWFNYTCKLKLKGTEEELTVSRNYYKAFKDRFVI